VQSDFSFIASSFDATSTKAPGTLVSGITLSDQLSYNKQWKVYPFNNITPLSAIVVSNLGTRTINVAIVTPDMTTNCKTLAQASSSATTATTLLPAYVDMRCLASSGMVLLESTDESITPYNIALNPVVPRVLTTAGLSAVTIDSGGFSYLTFDMAATQAIRVGIVTNVDVIVSIYRDCNSLLSPVTCSASSGGCVYKLTSQLTDGGTYWVKLAGSISPARVSASLEFGLVASGCHNISLLNTSVCAGRVSIVSNYNVNESSSELAAMNDINGLSLIYGTNPSCLNSIKDYVCRLHFSPCDQTGITASTCLNCSSIVNACATNQCGATTCQQTATTCLTLPPPPPQPAPSIGHGARLAWWWEIYFILWCIVLVVKTQK